jgi:hypothetical protein
VVNAPLVGNLVLNQGITGTNIASNTYIANITGGPTTYTLTLTNATTAAVTSGTALTIQPPRMIDTRRQCAGYTNFTSTALTTPNPAFASPVSLTANTWYRVGLWFGGNASGGTLGVYGCNFLGNTTNGISDINGYQLGGLFQSAATLTTGTTLPSLRHFRSKVRFLGLN